MSEFSCKLCNYSTHSKFNYNRHLLSNKHLENESNNFKYVCECGKRYKKNNGLWKHKQKCSTQLKNVQKDREIYKNLVHTLINNNAEWQNKYTELQNIFIEEGKELRNTIINMQPQSNTINNTQNVENIQNIHNTFNLHVFLNETCKDAMNIDDFIDSIKISIEDLKNLAKNGYIEGISDLLIKNLKELDITQRPLHCSDLKRETIYIKDKKNWNKENDERRHLTKIATDITRLNTIALQNEYQKVYPHCLTDIKSKEHDEYGKIAYEAFGGKIDIDKANKKLFRNIMKFVTIDKNNLVNLT